MKLNYDAFNDTYTNAKAVDVRGIDFGGVKGIDYIDYFGDYPVFFTSVYSTMVLFFSKIILKSIYR